MFNIAKITLVVLTAILIFPASILAGTTTKNPLDRMVEVGEEKGPYSSAGMALPQMLGVIISSLLGLLGVIFIFLIIYSGYNWMIARGEEEKVTKAKDTIQRAIIGLIIIVGAYAIWGVIAKIL